MPAPVALTRDIGRLRGPVKTRDERRALGDDACAVRLTTRNAVTGRIRPLRRSRLSEGVRRDPRVSCRWRLSAPIDPVAPRGDSHDRIPTIKALGVLLRADELTKRYGSIVGLDAASFEITDQVTGLVGHNGAGKSTAIKLFLGLIEPTSGRADVLGRPASADASVRERLGYMPEHDCLPSNISGAEFLRHMAEVSGLPPRHARLRAADSLRHVGLFEERYRPLGEYSTGMKQRVKLAQALVHDPVLALLDEPTAGLDPGGREEMLALVRRTQTEFGIGLVMSSHLMADVERTCDRLIVLEGGRVTRQGEVSTFTRESETLYVEVTDRRNAFVQALAKRGLKASTDGTAVAIEGAGDEDYDAIRDALVESAAPLRRMAPGRRALAELFDTERT